MAPVLWLLVNLNQDNHCTLISSIVLLQLSWLLEYREEEPIFGCSDSANLTTISFDQSNVNLSTYIPILLWTKPTLHWASIPQAMKISMMLLMKVNFLRLEEILIRLNLIFAIIIILKLELWNMHWKTGKLKNIFITSTNCNSKKYCCHIHTNK